MRKKLWGYCLTLALLVFFAVLSPTTEAAEYQIEDAVDYVILIDASDASSDGTAVIEMCSLLTELIADRNARISVIAYGYDESKSNVYPYTHHSTPPLDSQLVHLLLPLEEVGSTSEANIRQAVQTAFDYTGKLSPHGQALLAAVDLLMSAGTPTGQGCIIMISDGLLATSDFATERTCRTTALSDAASRNWPIYTLQLLRSEVDPAEDADATAMMKQIAADSGARIHNADGQGNTDYGTWQIQMPSQQENTPAAALPVSAFHNAVMQIIQNKAPEAMTPENGSIAKICQVSNLTCSRVIAFSGRGLHSVTIDSKKTGTHTFVKSGEDGYISASFGDSYIVVRLNAPLPGEWTVTVKTNCPDDVYVCDLTFNRPDITLSAKIDETTDLASSKNYSILLEREQNISFCAAYSYRGIPLEICQEDGSTTAKLEIQSHDINGTNQFKELMVLNLSPERMGHTTGGILLNSFLDDENQRYGYKTGRYRARVVLTSNQQQTLHSEWFYFAVNDPVFEWTGEKVLDAKCSANGTFEIDLKDLLKTYDNDELKFTLLGHNQEDAQFVFLDKDGKECTDFSAKPTRLKIKASEYTGDFKVTLHVSDGLHEESIKILVTVTKNEAVDNPTPVTLYEDSIFFSSRPRSKTITLDNEVVRVTPLADYDREVVAYAYNCVTDELTIHAKKPGTTTLVLELEYSAKVKDAYGDYIPEIQPRAFRVEVKSALGYRICFALIVAILLIAVVLYLRKLILINAFRGHKDCEVQFEGLCTTFSISFNGKCVKFPHIFGPLPMDRFIIACFDTLKTDDGRYNINADNHNRLLLLRENYQTPAGLDELRLCCTLRKRSALMLKGLSKNPDPQKLEISSLKHPIPAHANEWVIRSDDTVSIRMTFSPKSSDTTDSISLTFKIAPSTKAVGGKS